MLRHGATLNDFMQWDNTLFDNILLPECVSQPTLVSQIMLNHGLQMPVNQHYDVFKSQVKIFFDANYWNFQKLCDLMQIEYNPLHNYDRHEEINGLDISNRLETTGEDKTTNETGSTNVTATNTTTGSEQLSGSDVRTYNETFDGNADVTGTTTTTDDLTSNTNSSESGVYDILSTEQVSKNEQTVIDHDGSGTLDGKVSTSGTDTHTTLYNTEVNERGTDNVEHTGNTQTQTTDGRVTTDTHTGTDNTRTDDSGTTQKTVNHNGTKTTVDETAGYNYAAWTDKDRQTITDSFTETGTETFNRDTDVNNTKNLTDKRTISGTLTETVTPNTADNETKNMQTEKLGTEKLTINYGQVTDTDNSTTDNFDETTTLTGTQNTNGTEKTTFSREGTSTTTDDRDIEERRVGNEKTDNETEGTETTNYGKLRTTQGQSEGETLAKTLSELATKSRGRLAREDENRNAQRNHIYGNVGVTTSQKMFMDEVDIADKFNIYDFICRRFADRLLIGVWD